MSPTRIEETEEEAELFELIEEPNLPLSFDSGAAAHVHFKRRDPTKHRSQGNTINVANGSESASREFKNQFTTLLLSGTFQQVHPANLLTRRVINDGRQSQICARATSHVQSKQRTATNRTRITAGGNRYQTVDTSNGYRHLLVRATQQQRATYSPNFFHTHATKQPL